MWQLLDLCIWRPAAALFSMGRMVGEDIAPLIKVDAVVSRAIHIFSRPAIREGRATGHASEKAGNSEGDCNTKPSGGRGAPEVEAQKHWLSTKERML